MTRPQKLLFACVFTAALAAGSAIPAAAYAAPADHHPDTGTAFTPMDHHPDGTVTIPSTTGTGSPGSR